MKRAQLFMNTVTVKSNENNTAFINGLARILSEGSFIALPMLKAINKDKIAEEQRVISDHSQRIVARI